MRSCRPAKKVIQYVRASRCISFRQEQYSQRGFPPQKLPAPKPACCRGWKRSRKCPPGRRASLSPAAKQLQQTSHRRVADPSPALGYFLPKLRYPPNQAAPQDRFSAPPRKLEPEHRFGSKDEIPAYKSDEALAAVSGGIETAKDPRCWPRLALPDRTPGKHLPGIPKGRLVGRRSLICAGRSQTVPCDPGLHDSEHLSQFV